MPEVDKHKIVLENGSTVSIYDLVKRSNFTPEHLAEILTETYNSFGTTGFDAKVADSLTEKHRTLQQCVIRGFLNILIGMGKKAGGTTDPRNEAGIALCKRLGRLIEEEKIFLPFI